MEKKNKIAILLVGEAATGKTSLINRYITNTFNPNSAATIGIDYRTKKIKYKSVEIKLEIWDTAGQEKYQALPATFYSRADAIAVVFSLTNSDSFKKVEVWIESILNYKSQNEVTLCILGNKSDLVNERAVTNEEIDKFMEDKQIKFFPVSALSGDGVEGVFNYFTEEVVQRKKMIVEDPMEGSFAIEKGKKKKKDKKCCE